MNRILLLIGVAGLLLLAQNKFKEYPGVEYNDFPLPADYLNTHEWTRARLKYTSFYNIHGFDDDPGEMNLNRWTVDYPRSDRHFLRGLKRLTRIDASSVEQVTAADGSNDIFNWPSSYSVEPGYWDLTDTETKQLREYLLRGGFLMIDDDHGTVEWTNILKNLHKIFPDRRVVDLDDDNEIFHVLYDLDDRIQIPGGQFLDTGRTYEYDGTVPKWRAILDDRDRIMIAICHNMDLGDAWELADDLRYPEKYSNLAYRIGINYFIYDLTH